jgi:hypothetical protein
VRETGLEPVRPKTGDFKSPVATITPLSHIWYQELDSNQPHLVLQTSALPDELSWLNYFNTIKYCVKFFIEPN